MAKGEEREGAVGGWGVGGGGWRNGVRETFGVPKVLLSAVLGFVVSRLSVQRLRHFRYSDVVA